MSRPHHYVECDVPEGMTLREYHAARRSASKHASRGLVARLRRRKAQRRQAAAAAQA